MIELIKGPVTYAAAEGKEPDGATGSRMGTMAYKILSSHNTSRDDRELKIRFDAMASHDITYVGIIQTARASGLREFPMPYVLTNCHNSLCAVGGTINEDDHVFGLSAAKKYGGDFVPAHQAVIHQYMREMHTGCGRMILGSDSHTRYGALGTMAVGEGGPELVKQLLGRTYDISYPQVVLVYLEGSPEPGVGPQDIALALIGSVFKNGFVKNKVMEFAGPAIKDLSIDYRNGIDVMTTEAACLSTIWQTDERVKNYYQIHNRADQYKELRPDKNALYDACIKIDLSAVKPMIAMPFHPSNVYTVNDFINNSRDILEHIRKDADDIFDGKVRLDLTEKISGKGFYVDQAVIGGCSGGTYENIEIAANILRGKRTGDDNFWLSIYPASQPIYVRLNRTGAAADLMEAGVNMRSAFCGPCFGAGDVPANNSLSIRHNTRNFPNREGSKPGQGQIAAVALMDARSIAATALNGGRLTPATDIEFDDRIPEYVFEGNVYKNRVYKGYGRAEPEAELKFGPNIKDWPEMDVLGKNILLKVVSVIRDPVTTTDELIPSGETSSYRSNPLKLAEFALSRKDPGYVRRAKDVRENKKGVLKEAGLDENDKDTSVGSVIYANSPGDGSAREQAASVQKVLGGWANICIGYATKRYRSNLINWGIIPFILKEGSGDLFETGDIVFIPDIRDAIIEGREEIKARLIKTDREEKIVLSVEKLTDDEKNIILDGCLINYYRNGR